MRITFEFEGESPSGSGTADAPALAPAPRVLPRRIDLASGVGTCEALDLEVVRSTAGTPIVRSTRDGEQLLMTLNVSRVQLTGVEFPTASGEGVRRRCVADGAGAVAVTDQRLIGVITASRVHGMAVSLDTESSGTALVFAVSRNDLADVDVTHTALGKRLRMAALYGLVTVRITPSHVLERGTTRWRFPETGEIESSLTEFVAGASARDEPEPAPDATLLARYLPRSEEISAPAGDVDQWISAGSARNWATAALVLGVVGLIAFVPAAIAAWVIGAQARRACRELPEQAGYGRANVGYVLGIVGTVWWVVVIVGYVVLLLVVASAVDSGSDYASLLPEVTRAKAAVGG